MPWADKSNHLPVNYMNTVSLFPSLSYLGISDSNIG